MHVIVDGTLTNYKKYGSAPDPTLVILHGWMRSLQDWVSVAEELKDKYNIILVDMPGFGRTPKPETDFDIEEYADFIEKFLQELEVEKYTLLGHSFGGRVALVLAARNKRLQKLVLVDSAGTETKNIIIKFKVFLVGKLLKPIASILLPEKFLWHVKYKLGSRDYKHAKEMRGILIKTVSRNLSDLLPKIVVPTFIIWGDRDEELPLSTGISLRDSIANSKLRVVWGSGHHPHLEKSTKFMEILREFI